MRITEHPILGPAEAGREITIFYNGSPVSAIEGEPIAAALMNAGVRSFRRTAKRDEPRGLFCAIGRCTDCMMIVNGKPNVRTCITAAKDGMRVETQYGYGGKKAQA